MLKFLSLTCLLQFHMFGNTIGQSLQHLRLFNSTGCSGSGFQTFNDSGFFQLPHGHSNFASAGLVGMWKISLCTHWGSCNNGSYLGYGDATSGGCMRFPSLVSGSRVAITRYGDASMSNSSILHAFSGSNFTGTEYKVLTNLIFTATHPIRSYFFTGSKNAWQIYDQPGFKGNSTCIPVDKATKLRGRGFNFAFTKLKPIVMRSVRSVPKCPMSAANCNWSDHPTATLALLVTIAVLSNKLVATVSY